MTTTSPRDVWDKGTVAPGASGPRIISTWSLPGQGLDLSGPIVMGILNLTPDSFSDGGELRSLDEALERAERLVEEGAGILDIGGESTRPGAENVPVAAELDRILPVLEAVRARLDVPISVDTRKAEVAASAIRAGARIVNDVSGLNHDPDMARVVAEGGASLVLSHMRGSPATMKQEAHYGDLLGEVTLELGKSLASALAAGIPEDRIVVDPGIGFAKNARQSLTLLQHLDALFALKRPILVGPSRKSFIGEITGLPPAQRVAGTAAACVLAYERGARIFRVHDVQVVVQALEVARAILDID